MGFQSGSDGFSVVVALRSQFTSHLVRSSAIVETTQTILTTKRTGHKRCQESSSESRDAQLGFRLWAVRTFGKQSLNSSVDPRVQNSACATPTAANGGVALFWECLFCRHAEGVKHPRQGLLSGVGVSALEQRWSFPIRGRPNSWALGSQSR